LCGDGGEDELSWEVCVVEDSKLVRSRVCSVLKKLSIVRVVCVYIDFQEDSASASSAPLA
jgi:hypothetical protein